MVKPLSFKGDKKPKKRKRAAEAPSTNSTNDTEPASQLQKVDHHHDDGEDGHSDDSWVSADSTTDVVGPIMIVLPTEKPSALACDATGQVFALPIVNIVDGNPSSAEPHDVRMVWVANQVSGTQHMRFKGHHGRFLACDKIGALSATSEAVSPLECFNVIANPNSNTPGTFQLQTLHETLITIKPNQTQSTKSTAPAELRGDEDDSTAPHTIMRIRMQARFKPRIKTSKEEKALSKISRRELEEAVGRRLEEDEVRILKRARRQGDYHEKLLDMRIKNRHDKYG
ncbi:hypothetical protein E4U34_004655 [Claviceps purpurea]|nr:hypothetical protein E4U34_004655 [Claviceps purpurea]